MSTQSDVKARLRKNCQAIAKGINEKSGSRKTYSHHGHDAITCPYFPFLWTRPFVTHHPFHSSLSYLRVLRVLCEKLRCPVPAFSELITHHPSPFTLNPQNQVQGDSPGIYSGGKPCTTEGCGVCRACHPAWSLFERVFSRNTAGSQLWPRIVQ